MHKHTHTQIVSIVRTTWAIWAPRMAQVQGSQLLRNFLVLGLGEHVDCNGGKLSKSFWSRPQGCFCMFLASHHASSGTYNTSSKEDVLSNSAGFNHFFWLGDGKSPIARNQIVSPKHLIVSILSPSWQVFSQFHPRLFPYRHLRLCSYTTDCKWHLNPFVMSPYWSFRQGVFVCSKPNCNVSIPASNFDLFCTCAAVAWLTNWTQIKE